MSVDCRTRLLDITGRERILVEINEGRLKEIETIFLANAVKKLAGSFDNLIAVVGELIKQMSDGEREDIGG